MIITNKTWEGSKENLHALLVWIFLSVICYFHIWMRYCLYCFFSSYVSSCKTICLCKLLQQQNLFDINVGNREEHGTESNQLTAFSMIDVWSTNLLDFRRHLNGNFHWNQAFLNSLRFAFSISNSWSIELPETTKCLFQHVIHPSSSEISSIAQVKIIFVPSYTKHYSTKASVVEIRDMISLFIGEEWER